MFIDIHVHLWIDPAGPKHWGLPAFSTPEHLIQRYDELGIESAVVLPIVNPECAYFTQSNEEVLAVARHFPGRFIPFCNIDPRAAGNSPFAPLNELFEHYKTQGAKGIGEVCANISFRDPLARNLFRHAEAVGFPLTFHISPEFGNNYGLVDEPGLPHLEQSLVEFPNLIFLGHSQAFWCEIAPLARPGDRWGYPTGRIEKEGVLPQLMRKYPNLHGDLSAGSGCNALSRDPVYAARFLDEFQDRLYFGTDICAPTTDTPLVDFMLKMRDEGKVSAAVFEKVARGNARRLLKL